LPSPVHEHTDHRGPGSGSIERFKKVVWEVCEIREARARERLARQDLVPVGVESQYEAAQGIEREILPAQIALPLADRAMAKAL